MFTKNNIDYRNPYNREDNLEEFTIKNMDTVNLKSEEHVKTKSMILAPFNTSLGNSQFLSKELEIKNDYMIYKGKVREMNKNYELNNNCEIDNGMIISPNGNTFNSINNKSIEIDKKKSVKNTKNITSMRASGLSSPLPETTHSHKNTDFNIDDKLVEQVVSLGYSSNFVIRSLLTNDLNYATSCYYLLTKQE